MKLQEFKKLIREEVRKALSEDSNLSHEARIKKALIKTNDHAPGGVFDDELQDIIRSVIRIYKSLPTPELKRRLVDLEEKHAELQAKKSGRPIRDTELEVFYKRYGNLKYTH